MPFLLVGNVRPRYTGEKKQELGHLAKGKYNFLSAAKEVSQSGIRHSHKGRYYACSYPAGTDLGKELR